MGGPYTEVVTSKNRTGVTMRDYNTHNTFPQVVELQLFPNAEGDAVDKSHSEVFVVNKKKKKSYTVTIFYTVLFFYVRFQFSGTNVFWQREFKNKCDQNQENLR